MAEATVGKVASGLVSLAAEEIIHAWNLHEDLDTLRERLELIHALMSDAYSKKLTLSSVQSWLNKLEAVVNVADVFMDELAYEVTRRKMESRHKVLNFFIPSKNSILYRFKARKIVFIHAAFDKNFKWAGDLGLHAVAELNSTVQSSDIIRTTLSFEDESKVVGRDGDVSYLVQTVCKIHQEDLQVVAIIGMGGQGKTTIARMVYNTDAVIKMFPNRMWVTVSDDFDFIKILNQMVQSLTSTNLGLNNTEGLFNALRTRLEGQKFLLVLDDVWNEESLKWDEFRDSLLGVCGSKGSNVLVTTRNQQVIDAIQDCVSYPVKRLPEDDSWALFKQRAFSHGVVENEELAALGRSMVEKCVGIPLAIKALGGLLSSVKSKGKWLEIQNSEIWKSKGVLPSLKLSYDNLPYPSLKHCFSYCSILPKDSDIWKDKLVKIWMALGFLLPTRGSNELMEDIGNEYFNILLCNSLLQDVKRDKYGNVTYCKMHDLVHDLALDLSKHHSVTVKAGQDLNHDCKAVYVRLDEGVSDIKPTNLKRNFEKVQVLYAGNHICRDVLPYLTHLTVLVLTYDKAVEELPSSLRKMKYLKHLDISEFYLKLPTYISELYNLQTLRVWKMEVLPKKFCNLINLRHLYVTNKHGKRCMFNEIEALTSLQTLPYFVVSRVQNCLFGQLGGLNNLSGKLRLYGLREVANGEEANKAKLFKKSNIQHLVLDWCINEEVMEDKEYNDEDVMEGLKPHPNLEGLKINQFKGKKFASWITMMTNLMEITLRDCNRCEVIPLLGHLPKLTEMKIEGMKNVMVIGNDFCGGLDSVASTAVTTMYPSLTKLRLWDMPKLEEWAEAVLSKGSNLQSVFPKLERLEIWGCPSLRKIPNSSFPSLKKLEIRNMESSLILEAMSINLVSSLTYLRLTNISDGVGSFFFSCSNKKSGIEELLENNSMSLTCMNIEHCKGLTRLTIGVSLEELVLYNCPDVISINLVEGPVGLQSLSIGGCPSSLPDSEFSQSMSTLEELVLGPFWEEPDELVLGPKLKELNEYIWPFSSSAAAVYLFPNLIKLTLIGWKNVKSIQLDDRLSSSFPTLTELEIWGFSGVKDLPDSIATLPSLTMLKISCCENLESLPMFVESHSLQWLEIMDCEILAERCRKGSGPEWFKIQHIPHISYPFC